MGCLEENLIKMEIYGKTQLYQRALWFWEVGGTKFKSFVEKKKKIIKCLLSLNSSAQNHWTCLLNLQQM